MPSKTKKKRPNRLIEEKSPYLLQHAHNPVDWFPWSTESFEKARREDKPVFLSIGYSTCHWCHVMERECFEDAEVARLMNEVFVSVKVDREERPDLDGIYMTVCQIMTGTGGWPLTIIMTPRKKPFFAGTYIPKESRFGLMGMLELVPRIKKAWKTRRRELEEIGKKVRFELERTDRRQKIVSTSDMGKEVLDEAYERLVLSFDDRNGGFGLRPKFPPGHSLLFLLRYWKRSKEKFAISMVKKTLQSMRRGGIFDHVGLGFHRYATDAAWNVPHFEKMLYDQATFALVYAEAYQAAGLEQFSRTAHEIFDYVLRDLTSPEGGFYSAEDADSEGEEGKFYLWTEDEIREVLPSNDAVLAIQVFNVRREGNFFQEATKKRDGTNILHLSKPLEQTASELKMTLDELSVLLSRIREKLFTYRAKRVRPSKDDKILCDWNGLMIAALARAAQIFDEKRYLQAAVKAAEFILNKMCTRKGKLFHRLAKGEVAVDGFLDDYAFLVWGLVEIYETGFDVKFLRLALDLTDEMLKKFWDKDFGGFYYTAKDIDKGLVRQKKVHDSGAPSGNSVAMLNLVRLARLTGKATYEEKAARIGRAFSDRVREMPEAHSLMLVAFDFAFGPTYTVVLVGEKRGEDTTMMIKALRKQFTPNIVVLFKPEEEMESELADDFRWTLDYGMINDKATAYACQNQTCLLPTNNVKKMLDQLGIT